MRMIKPLILSLLIAGPAWALPPLSEQDGINDGLLAVGIADEIRTQCPDISARMFKALSFMNGLKSQAKSLGYSDAEVKAYTKNKTEKAKMRARGEAYLKEHGVTPGDAESYCALGRAEIEKNSQIGALLRAK